jgi:hypothetical protein
LPQPYEERQECRAATPVASRNSTGGGPIMEGTARNMVSDYPQNGIEINKFRTFIQNLPYFVSLCPFADIFAVPSPFFLSIN